MIHAASMPALNLHDGLLQNQGRQAHDSSRKHSAYHLAASAQEDQPKAIGTTQRFERNTNEIAEVDLTNEAILWMVLSTWGIDPSCINLPVCDFCHISNDDWLELLPCLIP
jgi:hypothetical protein